MNIVCYIHPTRTFLPCTGAGRYINNTILELASLHDVTLELLFSEQWLTENRSLPLECPLHQLPYHTFPLPENPAERLWKLIGLPQMDRFLPDSIDWLFAPMETYFPITKCPVAITIYDIQAFEPHLPWSQTWQHHWFRYKWGRWVRRAIDHSRIVFTISEFSKQRMVDLLDADPSKIVNIGCGVESPFFDVAQTPLEKLNLPVEYPYVFMIGGLREKKGGDHFLDVAQELRHRNSDIQIVIAGASEPEYVQAAKDHPNIKLLGIVSDEELPSLMRGSLCLLFLSLYEGFGIPALEAMAAGTPAVVSNRASLPEVVGGAGIIVEPDNPDEIVDILINLEKDFHLRQDYIKRGFQHVKSYTWFNCVDRLVTALKEFS